MEREKFILIAWSRHSKQETLGYNLIHVYVTAEACNVSKILCLLNSCMYRHFLTASVWYLRQLESLLSFQLQQSSFNRRRKCFCTLTITFYHALFLIEVLFYFNIVFILAFFHWTLTYYVCVKQTEFCVRVFSLWI